LPLILRARWVHLCRMYIRFVRQKIVHGTGARSGVLSAAYDLRAQNYLDEFTLVALDKSLDWFQDNLCVPERLNRSKSKGYYRRNTTGLSWFKPTAKDHLAKAFKLMAVLRENGYEIETLKTFNVGYIIFEDDYQIIAEPFADTPC
jgi:hypothetical protein